MTNAAKTHATNDARSKPSLAARVRLAAERVPGRKRYPCKKPAGRVAPTRFHRLTHYDAVFGGAT